MLNYYLLHCTILYYTILYYTILQYTMLCFTIVYHTDASLAEVEPAEGVIGARQRWSRPYYY